MFCSLNQKSMRIQNRKRRHIYQRGVEDVHANNMHTKLRHTELQTPSDSETR